MGNTRTNLIWCALATTIVVPVAAAAVSPLLAWRDAIYIVASFAGIIALVLLLVQPLLIGRYLPGLPTPYYRLIHRWTGGLLVLGVVAHVAGLWVTSPPDVIDALLFVSPTPFSLWGVIAMWAVFISALMTISRKWFGLRPKTWRFIHTSLAAVIVSGTIAHALLVQGAMEPITKTILCLIILLVTLKVFVNLRVWSFKIR